MYLKKKIILGFLISSVIIAILALSAFVNFIEIRKEIRFLELSDTIRSKSLQLRRHEKNFLLYKDLTELDGVYRYLAELKAILKQSNSVDSTGELKTLKTLIEEYGQRFNRIEFTDGEFLNEFNRLRKTHSQYSAFFPLIESTFLERPLINATLLQTIFDLPAGEPLIRDLRELDAEITALRKSGEEILVVSKDLDRSAREKVDDAVSTLQIAAMILFPLFFLMGLSILFIITHSVVNRLKILTAAIEKTGKGDFSSLAVPEKHDEVGVLITAFNKMENDLIMRDNELNKKNKELLQSRKLASIGTLASGVAHELNNPLNNIYISAQILEREAKEACSPIIRETVGDIVSQTVRVKRIVGDLLEFARGREPHFRTVGLNELIKGVYKMLKVSMNMDEINFVLNSNNDKIIINADQEQMERVLINLFTNAVEAMQGKGDIIVTLCEEGGSVRIWVSDTGRGMTSEEMEKVFEPFFTTKDKGTGLGLAIVFNIIKKHEGEIFVDSLKGKGTTFYIVLPRGEKSRVS